MIIKLLKWAYRMDERHRLVLVAQYIEEQVREETNMHTKDALLNVAYKLKLQYRGLVDKEES